jgi:alpha-glucosidase (family GH31 glycosyl hydrolase)
VQYGGGGGDHNPWNFEAEGESQFDEETLAAFKRYATWHVRMFPYFELLAARAGATGEPFVLPEGLAYPDLGIHPQDAYLVGADVFVAPVETEGAVTRELTLPPGRWMHWWTGEALEGEQTVDAALGDGPLFQREGSAIPMLRRSVVTLAPSDGSADSWADDAGPLNVRVVPGDGAAFVLATGEALSWSGATATLASGDLYAGWDLEIWAPDGVTSVTVDGEGLAVGAEGCEACWFEEAPWVRVVLDGGTVVTVE